MVQDQQINTTTEHISNQSLSNEDKIYDIIATIINQKHEALYKELKGTKDEIKNYILKVGISTTLLNIASSIAIYNWAIIAPAMPILGIVAASILGVVAITAGMVCIYKNRMQIKEGLQSVAGKTEKGFKLVADKTIEGASSIKNKINNGSVYVKDKINESYNNSKDSLKRKVAITARRLSDFSDETRYMEKNSKFKHSSNDIDELLSKTKQAFLHDKSNQSVKLVLNAIKSNIPNIRVNLIEFEGDESTEKKFIGNLNEKSLKRMVTKERPLEEDKYYCNLIFSQCGDVIEKTLAELKTTSEEEDLLLFDSIDNTNVKDKFATIKRRYSLPQMLNEESTKLSRSSSVDNINVKSKSATIQKSCSFPNMLNEESAKPSRSNSILNSSGYASSDQVSNSSMNSPKRIVINAEDINSCKEKLNRTGGLEKLGVPSLIKGDISMQIHSEKQIG